jgi:diguanylate cyclase (GGDEF)-like protein
MTAAPRGLLPSLLAGAAVLAAAGVLLAMRLRPDVAVVAGCLFSGGVAVLSGSLVLFRAQVRQRAAQPALRLIGTAMAVWGLGQALVAAAIIFGHGSYPTIGDGVATAAGPMGIAGLLLALRGGGRYAGSLRFGLDSMLLGSAIALVVWRAGFGDVLFRGGATLADFTSVLVLMVEVTLVALLLLAYLRDLDRALLLAVIGMAVYCTADLLTVHALVQPGGRWPPLASALWCVAWPCVAVGLVRYSPGVRGDDDWYDSDIRVTSATAVLSIGGLLVFVLMVMHSPKIDGGSMAIGMFVIAVFGAREVVSGRQRRRLLATLTQYAVHDPLTNLKNRRALLPLLRTTQRTGGASLLTLDLDGFKDVNDILGHTRGDDLLVAVSRRVEACLPSGAQAFRIGGDEFAVVVPGTATDATDAATSLLEAVRRAAVDVPGAAAVGVTASVGVAWMEARPAAERRTVASAGPGRRQLSDDSPDTLSVLVKSGAALGAAKRSGRDRVEYYDGQVAAHHRRQLLIERRLHEAIALGEIAVHYQPVLDLLTRRVVGLEALARWTDPVLGRVGPDEFIPLAERCGLIDALGAHVLRRSLGDFTANRPELDAVKLAVNVSPIQLRRADFGRRLMSLVEDSGLDPQRLVLEVTESTFLDADDVGLEHLAMVRAEGANVAIDDFGSGFSSLAYLSRLPANIIKVDQSLTAMVVEDTRSQAVLRTIADLGTRLAVDGVVEGIETEAVHDVVVATGVAFGQGWLYSAAVPVDRLADAIAEVNAVTAPVSGGAPRAVT